MTLGSQPSTPSKSRSKKIFLIGGSILITLGVWFFLRSNKTNEITYKEAQITKRDLTVKILTTGSVQPQNRLEIKAPISGRMEEVLVKEGQTLRKGQILAWMSSSERAALLDAARSQGVEELKKWKELYRPTPLVAPINGTLILRNIEPGQTFTNNDAILVMSDRLTIKAQFDETDIAQVKLEQEATVILDAYPSQSIPAKIDQIAFEAKTVNNVTTYVVDVLPIETPDFMRSGMTANVSVLVDSKKNVLSVGTEFLERKDDGSYAVLKKVKDSTPQLVDLQTGISDAKFIEVLSGLNEGDVVLKANNQENVDKNNVSNPFSPFRPAPTRNRGSRASGSGSKH